ncbi:hypothetical protein [Paenibacillus antarcticus]|nr:hypothetical protein [Paenibacillus antarcticus]
MKFNKRVNFFSVCFGKSETAVLDKTQNLLEIHTTLQTKPIFIALGNQE